MPTVRSQYTNTRPSHSNKESDTVYGSTWQLRKLGIKFLTVKNKYNAVNFVVFVPVKAKRIPLCWRYFKDSVFVPRV